MPEATPQNESQALALFRRKCSSAMNKIKNLDDFRQTDEMVDYVLKVGKRLFTQPLDQQSPDQLIQTGGKLCGAYAYLGQKSSYARAERDVFQQKSEEVSQELLLQHLDEDYKVTEARALIASEMAELKEFVIGKDAEKNQWENITEAADKMISFLQSAIKIKEGERFSGSRLQNNG